jgi:hypothetical protein
MNRKREEADENIRYVKPRLEERSLELPWEQWLQICASLDVPSLFAFASTCHAFYNLIFKQVPCVNQTPYKYLIYYAHRKRGARRCYGNNNIIGNGLLCFDTLTHRKMLIGKLAFA